MWILGYTSVPIISSTVRGHAPWAIKIQDALFTNELDLSLLGLKKRELNIGDTIT
jgi:hypothetical protein